MSKFHTPCDHFKKRRGNYLCIQSGYPPYEDVKSGNHPYEDLTKSSCYKQYMKYLVILLKFWLHTQNQT
jgi:hypothetical protein